MAETFVFTVPFFSSLRVEHKVVEIYQVKRPRNSSNTNKEEIFVPIGDVQGRPDLETINHVQAGLW